MIIFGEPTGEILIFSFFQMELDLGNWICNDSWVNSLMESPCELLGEFFGEKIGIREFFSIEFCFYRNQKISKLPAVKIYFSDAPFFSLNGF